jgi:hypothetical protein
MAQYERAERLKTAGNDDAILRWNSCVRMLKEHGELKPEPVDLQIPVLGE